MSGQLDLGQLDITPARSWQFAVVRWLLPVGWGLSAIGYLGPWIAHPTAALALSGADMAEFVKFLPHVLEGSLRVTRQCFYLPPVAVVISIALLIGSRHLYYGGLLKTVGLLLAAALGLQLLPPAWSPAALMAPEFRAQAFAVGASWLALATFWLWRRLPAWLSGTVSIVLSLVAIILPAWQFLLTRPAIDKVYGVAPGTGWGLGLCFTGLAAIAAAGGLLTLPTDSRVRTRS